MRPTILYTLTDEAPLLATYSFKPIIEGFLTRAGVTLETRNISLAARILAAFPEYLTEDQRIPDDLAELGALTQNPEANIIKLPNISASVPQLLAAIKELQDHGYAIPQYPESPTTDEERSLRARFDAIKGSAVNPVLREGNSDRRAAAAVKNFAQTHPHSMGAWSADSRTRVATMDHSDFRHNEQSVIMPAADHLTIRHIDAKGTTTILKKDLPVLAGEVIDGTFLSARALDAFLAETIAEISHTPDVLLSVHLKATMMKVSDPIIFGHVVRSYFSDIYAQHGEELCALGLTGENGLGSILTGLNEAAHSADTEEQRAHYTELLHLFTEALSHGPALAMVNSERGITNLHVPSDVIIDASMPAMIRTSGHMWNAQGHEADTVAIIPDSSYAGIYQAVIDDCKLHGAYDPATMGSVPNVGLMAQKAEEYGSHDKTFKIPSDGRVEIVDTSGHVLIAHTVERGDIWRACQTKDAPIRNWVSLAVTRARLSHTPAIFWLDPERAHDRSLMTLVESYLKEEDTTGLDIRIMDPVSAITRSLERIRRGENTISVTGNVLRDYLTDLFPILELGTSAKMLSIVPLMAGGGLFETGAGGSAPKHVQQLLAENHLRWDSLGEFMALAESLRHASRTVSGAVSKKISLTADALDVATEKLLNAGQSPSRRCGEIDNRGSHLWLALYWAEALAEQKEDVELASAYTEVAQKLRECAASIDAELIAAQGHPVDLGGYYDPDPQRTENIMRPSAQFNALIDALR